MTNIQLYTPIKAAQQLCFDLSRSVKLHTISTSHTKEHVIAGRVSGVFREGDKVTWRAKHFGFYQQLTMQVYNVKPPYCFEDKMLKGVFKSIHHRHIFSSDNGMTVMKDEFCYETPAGILGQLFDRLVLKNYMIRLLEKRNQAIKHFAESGRWRELLPVNKYSLA